MSKRSNEPQTEQVDAEAGSASAEVRVPKQARSQVSYERMMAAAEALLVQRGRDDFTMTDVSRVGKISIGSLYCRFDSKDKLLRSVHARVMDRMEQDHAKLIMRARSRGSSLEQLICALIDELAEFMKSNASIMRPLMLRAPFDSVVQARGHASHADMERQITQEVLSHREAIMHPDPERAVISMFRVSYSALGRELGFGMMESIDNHVDWDNLKRDLGAMATSFLLVKPSRLHAVGQVSATAAIKRK